MPKDKRKARELVDADVGFISLVGRGANGEPFRVIKSEDGMSINLKGLFPVQKAAPAVAFVAIAKGYDVEQAKELLAEHDLATDQVEETDEATIFKQGDFDPEKVEVLKVSDSVVIGVTGTNIQKMFEDYNFESTDFKEVIAQAGAMPMIYTAKMALGDTIMNIMRQAGDRGETVNLVKGAISDFGAFVEGVLKGVPETAFKMDAALGETPIRKSDEAPAADSTTDAPKDDAKSTVSSDEGSDDVEKGGTGKKKPSKKDEKSDEDGKEGANKSDDAGEGDPGSAASDQDDSATDQALEKLTALVGDLGEKITKSQKATDERLGKLAGDLKKVSGRVEKAEGALNGTLVGGEDPDEVVKSGDDDGDEGFCDFTSIDTAYSRPFQN